MVLFHPSQSHLHIAGLAQGSKKRNNVVVYFTTSRLVYTLDVYRTCCINYMDPLKFFFEDMFIQLNKYFFPSPLTLGPCDILCLLHLWSHHSPPYHMLTHSLPSTAPSSPHCWKHTWGHSMAMRTGVSLNVPFSLNCWMRSTWKARQPIPSSGMSYSV